MKAVWLATALQVALIGAASGQPQPPTEQVIVQAPIGSAALNFVREITAVPSTYSQAPTWRSEVCFGMIGLRADAARPLLDRIGGNARDAGLRVAAPGCDPNVLIVVTDDVRGVVDGISSNRMRLMGVDSDYGVSMGPRAWRDFVETSRPVRWWQVSALVTRDNQPVRNARRRDGEIGETTVRDAGNLNDPTHLTLHHAFIVVDAARLRNLSATALADYLTMVSLAPINPNASVAGSNSILNLFSSSGAAELTDWDKAYLRGLYASNPDAARADQQQREIANRMTRME